MGSQLLTRKGHSETMPTLTRLYQSSSGQHDWWHTSLKYSSTQRKAIVLNLWSLKEMCERKHSLMQNRERGGTMPPQCGDGATFWQHRLICSHLTAATKRIIQFHSTFHHPWWNCSLLATTPMCSGSFTRSCYVCHAHCVCQHGPPLA